MDGAITGETVMSAAHKAAQALLARTDEFNRLDAVGGDGDMGTTLAAVSRALLADQAAPGESASAGFMRAAKVIAKTAGSSLCAVVMSGLMAAAQRTAKQAALPWNELSPLLADVLITMHQRSKAQPGDKTILDMLGAIAAATQGCADGKAFAARAQEAAEATLTAYRGKPASIGRLRLAPDKGVGHDDPGMVALCVAIKAMA